MPESETILMNGVSIVPTDNKRLEELPSGRRFMPFLLFVVGLAVLFGKPLVLHATTAATSELHSHILLIPFVFAYLVYIRGKELPHDSRRSIAGSVSLLTIGAVAWAIPRLSTMVSPSEHLAVTILAFVSFVAAGGFFFLGLEWMRMLGFSFAFLIFLVPLPDRALLMLETASQVASAEAADLFFHLSMTPVLRDGMIFQLPGIVIEVAQECSGIRSSLVLFITSLLASYLLLRSGWRRAILVGLVIPLGIVRNGFRIAVIGWLCAAYGPEMINSPIHRQGGPVFFVASLVPLLGLVWILRRGENKSPPRG
ncbi:MAG: archaeosortase/exosortase family protein [Blastocatellia bacterium]|nr:archaeosortase/exosortase family protein [Blastocatellia bacterium]